MDDDDRKARLAQALRQNLRRRKAQARGAGDATPATGDPSRTDGAGTAPPDH